MTEVGWLDDLSEDWPCQNGSEFSKSNPSMASSTNSNASQARTSLSRIPLCNKRRVSALPNRDEEFPPLNERSANENNISSSQRAPRLSINLRNTNHDSRGRKHSRVVSGSSVADGSIVHNTVQHKSLSSSPRKGGSHLEDTPEWKRRILHGDIAYGEQVDLLSPGGLENIFRPRPESRDSPKKSAMRSIPHFESSLMPSSPPPYNTGSQSVHHSSVPSSRVGSTRRQRNQPRVVNYRLAESDADQLSFNETELSQSSCFRPGLSMSQSTTQQPIIHEDDEGSVLRPSSPAVGLEAESMLHHSSLLEVGPRRVSGQSEIRHEGLSPILVAKHNNSDGIVNYAPVTSSATGQHRTSGHIVDELVDDLLESFLIDDEVASDASMENTRASEDFEHNGQFVQVRRGNNPTKATLHPEQQSPAFEQRSMEWPLGTSLRTEDAKKSEAPAHMQARVESIESEESSLPGLKPALVASVKESRLDSRPSSGGSPLKLFGEYDTFTNHKLQRTLSNIECNFATDDKVNDEQSKRNLATSVQRNEPHSLLSSPKSSARRHPQEAKHGRSRQLSKFGEGELDAFEFGDDVSHDSNLFSESKDDLETSFSGEFETEGGMFKFHIDASSLSRNSLPQRHTRLMTASTTDTRISRPRSARNVSMSSSDGGIIGLRVSKRLDILETPRKKLLEDSIGKRLLGSPFKFPTPKRRRTLHKGDISYKNGEAIAETVQESHQSMQTVLGKKRKDARQGEEQRPADPDVMAHREILTPQRVNSMRRRNTTNPTTDRGVPFQRHNVLSKEAQDKIARVQAELDGLRNSSISADATPPNYTRQVSITTQDFLQDAVNVMAALRSKLRGPALDRVDETEAGKADEDESFQESTKEPFSRPPSREGGPLTRMLHIEQNLEVLTHLQKFQDTNDMDIALASSMKSLNLVNDLTREFSEVNREIDETLSRATSRATSRGVNFEQAFDSDPANTQISHNPSSPSLKRRHSNLSVSMDTGDARFDSHGSDSSGPSTNRTCASTVSKTSESVKIITSNTVSHLIPEELAGMVYDKHRSTWVKRRTSSTEDTLHLDDTEEDPFLNIPDLTVDETREHERVLEVEARKKEEARISGVQQYQGVVPESPKRTRPGDPPLSSSPIKLEQANIHGLPAAEMSKAFDFATAPQGRHVSMAEPTALSGQGARRLSSQKTVSMAIEAIHDTSRQEDTISLSVGEAEEETEEEIAIFESRRLPQSRTPRKVTISFSSPIASIIEPGDYVRDAGRLFEHDVDRRQVASSMKRPVKNRGELHSRRPGPSGSRRNTPANSGFPVRPPSRIDEQDEDSALNNVQDRSMSLVFTPIPRRSASHQAMSVAETPSIQAQQDSLLNLTPLSDFTVHQKEESFAFEVSTLGEQSRQASRSSSSHPRSLSLSIKNLVQNITDVEQYEPFWEHMKYLNLKARRLQALHMLSKFCPNLEEFDVSDNEIHHLDGAPSTLRQLNISHNILSDLTSWGMLRNLQYLDVSNNDLRSLEGFKELVHLRSLRADNNKIESLNGILHLDGLMTLRMRNNCVKHLDLSGCNLPRLTDLDLKGNLIHDITNLHELAELTNLNLEENEIEAFPLNAECPTWRLKYLKLSGNRIETLDISNYTNLRILYLDRNRIGVIKGLLEAKHIDSLSLREQHPETKLSADIFDEAFEVRKLFLSGNFLGTFEPRSPYLNLQYLELASCGIRVLSPDLGMKLPNLRILNLNFNAIGSLKPLTSITRLKILHAAGNRFVHANQAIRDLAVFKGLAMLDLRNNPMTLGFYQPHCEKRLSYEERHEEAGKVEPFVMEEGDKVKDIAWEKRLDLGTAVERRIYELKVLGSCSCLRVLDGLVASRNELCRSDRVTEYMMQEGTLEYVDKNSSPGQDSDRDGTSGDAILANGETSAQKAELLKADEEISERWDAEDSFA